MHARIQNPAGLLPGATESIQSLIGATHQAGVDPKIMTLVHLRASQLNGCSACVSGGVKHARDSSERLFAVAAWRDAPYFSEAERAALALAEAVTRLGPEGVRDEVWNEAAQHFEEKQLAALTLWIATANLFNRVNVTTRQPAGAWG